MGSVDRDSSSERDLVVKHAHSASDVGGNRVIPMWDSSDPDRAPPPLPLNPGASSPITTRTGTSAAIQEAAKLLADKAKESMLPGDYITNKLEDRSPERSSDRSPERSPERSLVKGAQHRRLQSLQTSSVKDLRSYLDGSRSPEKQVPRMATPTFESNISLPASPERNSSRASTPTPSVKRPPPRPILGENTPPSSTMLALQTLAKRDYPDVEPLSNITNSSHSSSVRNPPMMSSGHDIASQISSLTSIANEMRDEMKTLTRRSKDNAKDLIELRGVTNSRDEDIRKALREMLTKMNTENNERPQAKFGIPFLDMDTTPKGKASLPRFGSSPNLLRDGRSESPNLGIDGVASVAMLEKIIKDMSTKEGQENLLSKLESIHKRSEAVESDTKEKVTELLEFVKQSSSQALVRSGTSASGARQASFDSNAVPNPLAIATDINHRPYTSPKAADFVTNDVIKMLKKILDSVVQSGQMVGETKASQKELRGQVLHMGRELGQKLDDAYLKQHNTSRAIEDVDSKQNIAGIIHRELSGLKTYLDEQMREHRRQSTSTIASKSSVDPREIYDMVKHALAEHQATNSRSMNALVPVGSAVDTEGILDAVRKACEEYQPDVHIEQIGLERDEILQCLKEGLDAYRADNRPVSPTMDHRAEIMEAVQQAMQAFQPPAPINELNELRDEILMSFRESLEQLRPDLRPDINGSQLSERDIEITRNTLVDVVRDTLRQHGPNAPMALEISREDLFDAVRVGLESSGTPFGQYGEQVVTLIHELVGDMRNEFKSYSAANGRDTEQVLDAMKDGLESLRGEIETYVDRSQDVTGKSEIIDAIRSGLENLRFDIEGFVSTAASAGPNAERSITAEGDRQHLLNALHAGFESFRVNGGFSGDNEGLNDMVKDELDQLRLGIVAGTAVHRDDILETIKEAFGSLQIAIDARQEGSGADLSEVRDELEHLRIAIAGTLQHSGSAADTDAIIDAVREAADGIRASVNSTHSSSSDVVEAVQEEIRSLKDTLGSSLVASHGGAGQEEVLQTLRQGLEEIRATTNTRDLGEALQGEFDKIRQSIAGSIAMSSGQAANDNIDTLRGELDDMRADIIKNLENPERQQKATGEFLDALNDGLEGLKVEVARMVDKPVDMTVSYDILDTLKDGISELRADLDKIKGRAEKNDTARAGNEIVLADGSEVNTPREVGPVQADLADMLKREDMKEMEVMLAQLQIKVEALSDTLSNPPAPPPAPAEAAPGTAMKDDLLDLEVLLKDLHAAVGAISSAENPAGLATKADTDALENYLANIKAQLEGVKESGDEAEGLKGGLIAIENLTRIIQDDLTNVSTHIKEQMPSQTDFGCIEVLSSDIKAIVERIRETQKETMDSEETVKKHHIDVLGHAIMELQNKVNDLKLPDPEILPEKTDIEQLKGLLNDFRESHDKMKETYETDVGVTAKAFDDRKIESEEIQGGILRLKDFLDEIREELRSKVEASNGGIAEVQDNVKSLESTVVANFGVSDEVKGMVTLLEKEFEKAHAALQLLKEHQAETADAATGKSVEHKDSVVAELTAKLDEHFATLSSNYDDTKIQLELQSKTLEDKATEQAELLGGSKEMAEELRVTIDTLGCAITSMQGTFDEVKEKLTDESNFKTLYSKIEESCSKMDEATGESKIEGQLTRDTLRDEISKSTAAITALQGEVTEYHPQFMVALRELQALVNQHYEHSRNAQDAAQEAARTASAESRSQAEELRSQFSALPALMPAAQPLPPIEKEVVTVEKYNDEVLQEKLDKLMEIACAPTLSEVQLERLDKIHEQVQTTAAELSAFVTSQTRLITHTEESKEKEAEETRVLLERRQLEKDQLEKDINGMASEKAALAEELDNLRGDRDVLLGQKNRLAADVSSIETALQIRREELHEMDAKADALERRILQGIMDQSRALLLTRSMKAASAAGGRKGEQGQRDVSNVSHSTITSLPPPIDPAKQALAMALKTRPGMKRNSNQFNAAGENKAARRIMSLSQISGNAPAGVKTYLNPAANPSNPQRGLIGNVRRAHSVKAPKPRDAPFVAERAPKSRVVSVASVPEADEDKENGDEVGALVLSKSQPQADEVHEIHLDAPPSEMLQIEEGPAASDDGSDTATERRISTGSGASGAGSLAEDDTSYADTYSEDRSEVESRSDASDDRRSSNGTVVTHSQESDLTDETGSYISESDDVTETIPASSVLGALSTPENGSAEELANSADDGSDTPTAEKSDDEEEDEEDEREEEDVEPTLHSAHGKTAAEIWGEDVEVAHEPASPSVAEPSLLAETATHVESGTQAYPMKDMHVFNTPAPSDSGLGSDLPTAAMVSGSETDYFRRRMEEAGSEVSGYSK